MEVLSRSGLFTSTVIVAYANSLFAASCEIKAVPFTWYKQNHKHFKNLLKFAANYNTEFFPNTYNDFLSVELFIFI